MLSAALMLIISCNIISSRPGTGATPSVTVILSPTESKPSTKSTATSTTIPNGTTATPSSTPNPSSKLRLAGYFYGLDRQDQVSTIPADKLTTLIYAFIDVSPSGECISADQAADKENFPRLQSLKLQRPHLELLLSVGGYSRSANFSNAALSQASRKEFAQSCVQFMKQNGFDGIDIDWELPVSGGAPGTIHHPEDKQNFTALLAELRSQLDALGADDSRHYLLTIAAPAGPSEYANIEIGAIGQYLDWVNLETYAVAVSGSPITNFNAPLYPSSTDPTKDSQRRLYDNADAAVRAYIKAGFPPEKILLGVPFYGRGWAGVADVNHGLYQPHAPGEVNDPGVPKGVWKSGSAIDYPDIEDYYLSSYARYWNDEVKAAWLFNPATGILISYEDPQSLEIKADYVLTNRLGGVMVWQLSQDDAKHTLLNSLYARLFP